MTITPQGSQMRVLLLGAGFIGSAIARKLVAQGHLVTALSRSAPSLTNSDGVNLIFGDASNMAAVAGFVAETDHVVYALGSSSPAESELDPASDVAAVLQPMIRLLELLRFRPGVGLTYISSGGAVYGNAQAESLSESTTPLPISSYGLLKLTCEKYIEMYSTRFGLNARVLRVSNAYGPGQSWSGGQGVVAHLMRSAFTGTSIPLYAPAQTIRDFVYIDDVAAAVGGLIGRPGGPVTINVGSGTGHLVQTVVDMIERISGRTIHSQPQPARQFDVLRNVLDCSLITSLIELKPTDLETGLTRTWDVAAVALAQDHNTEPAAKRAPRQAG